MQKAVVGWLANDGPRTTAVPARNEGDFEARNLVLERIKKCLDRAHHENANENEARAATRSASKYMQ